MALSSALMLGIGIAVLFVILLIINVYIVAYFAKPTSENTWWTKGLIIGGLQLTSFTVMMVSVDAANNGGNPMCDKGYLANDAIYCGGIDFHLVWQILFLAIFIVLVMFIPFATFYWEASADVENKKPFREAVCYEMVVIGFILCVVIPLYYFSKESITHVPVKHYVTSLKSMQLNRYNLAPGGSIVAYLAASPLAPKSPFVTPPVSSALASITYPVTFDVYIVSLISWVGWFVFALFTGAGMAAVPIDLINAYIHRPVPLDPNELRVRKLDLQVRTSEILETSMEMKKTRQAAGGIKRAVNTVSDRMQVNKLTNMMYALEQEVAALDACQQSREGINPLTPFFQLFLGMLSAVLSITWMLQLVLYNLLGKMPLLNVYLLSFDSWFPMFGVVTYAIFSIYALLCTIKGCFKVGMRCLCCCQIHTMAVGKTEINSFLFNLAVVMLCATPLVHFCVQSFSGYASYSDAYLMFDVQIRNMAFFAPMFQKHMFTYILLSMFGITAVSASDLWLVRVRVSGGYCANIWCLIVTHYKCACACFILPPPSHTQIYLLFRPKDKDQFGDPAIRGRMGSGSSAKGGVTKGLKGTELVTKDRGENKL